MKIVKPSYEIVSCPDGKDLLKRIEQAARTCYKSENKIGSDSDFALVRRLIDSGHLAMIEFGHDIIVKFVSNRGFTHELVRHRVASFAQESTRYCNYSKGKFGSEITCVDPSVILAMRIKDPDQRVAFEFDMLEAWTLCEAKYMSMVSCGYSAEIAREVLPIGLKAEIVIKANPREWRHIFDLRCSKKAHPRMRELMIPLLHDLYNKIPILFDDLVEKYPNNLPKN